MVNTLSIVPNMRKSDGGMALRVRGMKWCHGGKRKYRLVWHSDYYRLGECADCCSRLYVSCDGEYAVLECDTDALSVSEGRPVTIRRLVDVREVLKTFITLYRTKEETSCVLIP